MQSALYDCTKPPRETAGVFVCRDEIYEGETACCVLALMS